jgi:hypothetical protein
VSPAISPTATELLKRWTTARARACRVGVVLVRSDPQDGPVFYFSLGAGAPRQHADMAAVEAFVDDLEGATT